MTREKILEDLLQSAANIAKRNGEDTHWRRFAERLEKEGIRGVTAKTFRVLQADKEVNDDGKFTKDT